jgi:O-acetyl-ADP-ribose deacetylase (regulator of RNase III)
VNDKALSWGAGFARAVQKKWPIVQQDFEVWAKRNRAQFELGNIDVTRIEESLLAVKMISQHGYGPSPTPRIRYQALEFCLKKLAEEAIRLKASVHMPRIGCGEAGGSWEIVGELIEDCLCNHGIRVTVYDLPDARKNNRVSQGSFFPARKGRG